MSNIKFTHLHTHTPEGSLLDGFMQIDKAIKKIKSLGMDSLAVSDHGTMAAHYKFNEEAKKANIHPVFGMEAYITTNKKYTKADFEKIEIERDEEDNYIFAFIKEEEFFGSWMPVENFPTKKIINDIERIAKKTYYPKLFLESLDGLDISTIKKSEQTKATKKIVENYIKNGYKLCVKADTSQKDYFEWFPQIGHLLLLAKNNEGYQNMITLNNIANLEGFYRKPRIDYEDIKKYGSGIIATSACLGSVPNQLLLRGHREEAIKELKKYMEAFDELYIELQPSRNPEQIFVNEENIKIAKELGLKIIVTCDAHMVDKEEEQLHQTMTNIGQGSTNYEEDESDISVYDTAYLMSQEEILSYGIPKEALQNAYELSHSCQVTFLDDIKVKYPEYEVPSGETFGSYLNKMAWQGLLDLFLRKDYIEDYDLYQKRLAYELDVIESKGLAAYFIIVSDYVQWAKDNGIYVGPGRGCTTKETQLYTEHGIKPIHEINVGEKVYTHTGDLKEVLNKFEYDIEKNESLINIRTYYDDYRGNTYTKDHKILAVKQNKDINNNNYLTSINQKPKWTQVGDLEVGDLVVFPKIKIKENNINKIDLSKYIPKDKLNQYEVTESTITHKDAFNKGNIDLRKKDNWHNEIKIKRYIEMNEEFCYWIGLMTTNGWLNKENESISICVDINSNHTKYPELINNIFGIKKVFNYKYKNLITYTFFSEIVKNLMFSLWEDCYTPQSINNLFLNSNETNRIALVKGLWESNILDEDKNKYISTSFKLIENIKYLLSSLNIPNGLTRRKDSSFWEINIPLDFEENDIQFYEKNEEYVLKRIYSLKEVQDDKVYDIEVEDNHSYLTTSFAAHNSGAGSLVCYVLSITNLDPIQHQLLFERFLNPERNSLPDLDLDFSSHRRHEVVEYLQNKYGKNKVASIGTYQTMTSKAILKNVGKVEGVDHQMINEWNKHIPSHNGTVMSIEDAVVEIPTIKKAAEDYPRVFNLAIDLQEMPKSSGIHACGFEISPVNLYNNLPLFLGKNGELVTQYEGPVLEKLGYIKFDILGVKVLSIIEIAVNLIEERTGIKLEMNELEPTDEKVFETIRNGNTQGIFQLSSPGMTNIFTSLKKVDFDSLIAGVSLYRPGPMQYIDEYVNRANGLTKPTYIVPELEDILKPTFGIAIYQESIMQITQALGGYSAGQADSFRKAIGKKSKEVMDKELPKLYQSIIDNGYSEEVAKAVNDIIEPFIGYGFNKSHAAAYAFIAYQTAYLKTYYPLEFFIANLTIEQNDKDEVALLIQDAERNGIKVLPPDVNLSKESFSSINDNTIVYGLGGIKSLKEKSIETIINTRPYENFYDFISKTEGSYLDKASLTALAFSGGFDNLEGFQEYNRAEINNIFMKHKNVKESEEDIELLETFNHFKKLELEKFYLGIYLSGHPLEGIAQPLNWEEINSNEDTYNTLCIVNNVKPIITKKGDSMAFITLSLIDRELEVVCFPNTWEKSLQLRKDSPYIPYNQIIKEGLIVRAKGKAEYNKSSMSYFLNDISIPLRHNKHLENFLLRVEAEHGIPVVEKEVIQMPVFNIDELF